MKIRTCLKLSVIALTGVLSFIVTTGCGATPESTESTVENISAEGQSSDEEATSQDNSSDESTIKDTSAPESVTDESDEATGSAEIVKEELPAFEDKIPVKFISPLYKDSGKIEEISYTTKDYFGDESEITKPAFVYLPNGYSEDKQYNVLYLMHGIGGNEREWGMYDATSRVKAIMDNLAANGYIDPFIVVAVNGRSCTDFANTNGDYNSFYCFGKELRNDLIPYIDEHYSTYAEYNAEGYDLTAARDHRAMAGLSMGGMQTINIGMCECLDILSYFGAFSAAPTTYSSSQIATELEKFEDYNVNYFYAVCGTEDGVALNSAKAAVTGLTAACDKFIEEENFTWQTVKGAHDFNVWYLGYYNFAKNVFRKN